MLCFLAVCFSLGLEGSFESGAFSFVKLVVRAYYLNRLGNVVGSSNELLTNAIK